MSTNFIGAKGSLKPQTDVSNIMQDWAKMIAAENTQQTPQEPLRDTVTEIIKTKLLNPVEMPRFTTIQDIFDAQKGEKLGTLANYIANNPDATRLLGSFLGGTYLDTRRNQFVHGGEEEARKQEAMMQAAQEKALEQQKAQNTIATNMYGDFLKQDIENLRNEREDKRFAKELEMKERELTEKERHNRAMEGWHMGVGSGGSSGGGGSVRSSGSGSGGGVITGGASGVRGIDLSKIKMSAAERKALTENKTTLANIDAGLKSLEKNKDAYTFWKGVLGADIANRIDPKGIGTRTQIDNITAVYRKWLTGAQMSDKERKAYERFLPAPTDNYNIVKAKLKGMKGAIERSNDAILSNYGISSGGNSDPLGLGL